MAGWKNGAVAALLCLLVSLALNVRDERDYIFRYVHLVSLVSSWGR